MKSLRQLPFHTRRDAWIDINLSAVEQNARALKTYLPSNVDIMAVIKADAYGRGATMILPVLEASGISMAGVASVDEALQIRKSGLTLPILVLGVTPNWAMSDALTHNVQITIFNTLHQEALKHLYEVTGQIASVHIKVDTGMHRIGIPWDEAAAWITQCQSQPYLEVVGVFSHLADTGNTESTRLQIERWQTVLDHLQHQPRWIHLANSAGTWHYPLSSCNVVRVGISLFGYLGDENRSPVPLTPVMSLKARVVHLHQILPGEGVSYGYTFRHQGEFPRTLATLPLGYADGIPRALSNHMQGLFQGMFVPQVGAITMDQMMFDVTEQPDIQIGDVMTLLGRSGSHQITLEDWASILQTIPYELMCSLRVRLPKAYTWL